MLASGVVDPAFSENKASQAVAGLCQALSTLQIFSVESKRSYGDRDVGMGKGGLYFIEVEEKERNK